MFGGKTCTLTLNNQDLSHVCPQAKIIQRGSSRTLGSSLFPKCSTSDWLLVLTLQLPVCVPAVKRGRIWWCACKVMTMHCFDAKSRPLVFEVFSPKITLPYQILNITSITGRVSAPENMYFLSRTAIAYPNFVNSFKVNMSQNLGDSN